MNKEIRVYSNLQQFLQNSNKYDLMEIKSGNLMEIIRVEMSSGNRTIAKCFERNIELVVFGVWRTLYYSKLTLHNTTESF